ncbi:MAG: phenylalanine--tRNA ligase subunit beta, partial [Candidatus Aureabacteria bacterium]|nr:phenylalanine--tRNA ligase subunit beta [Candidatus Auribacterota bacterium]
MKIPFNWLSEYVSIGLPPGELAERLTASGLEVEAITPVSPSFSGVVTGRILAVEPHPNADRLSLCRVDNGAREIKIVCGAKNMKAGDIAPFAPVGARLADGTALKAATLRGIPSEGMLCSERELGLGNEGGGIMILAPELTPGRDLAGVLGLNDWILEINVTPNRPDCLSVIGIAREVAAILGRPLSLPEIGVRESKVRAGTRVTVRVDDAEQCPRYCARVMGDVAVAPAPFWMRHRLCQAGVRVVNNIVDATNYVLLEYGQPLHAFDLAALRGGRIVVRAAGAGERIVMIDGIARELGGETLVIADSERPVAVAGVMGGRESEIAAGTREILIESAFFRPQAIRRTAARLGLLTDSSYRFERGVDPCGVRTALDRAAQLITRMGAGESLRGVIDIRARAFRAPRIMLRASRLNALLGTSLSPAKIKNDLTRLRIEVTPKGKGTLAAVPPSYRVDIKEEIDLVEEVARIEGYDQIPTIPPRSAAAEGGSALACAREGVRVILAGLGFSEAICLSFVGAAEMDRLGWPSGDPLRSAVRIQNPMSEELAFLRSSMLPPLMRSLALNASRGNGDLRLFELGTVFTPAAPVPREEERLAIAATGSVRALHWSGAPGTADFSYLKGVVETLAAEAGTALSCERAALPSCHPGRCAILLRDGTRWGWLGEIHPRVAGAYGVKTPVVFAELGASALFNGLLREPRYTPLPR